MKTFTKLICTVFLFFGGFLQAQIVNIPDQNFKEALLNQDAFGQPPIDINGDGEIQVSEAEALNGLIVGDPWISYNIQDMTGIEAFVNIHYLSCINNQLTTLDLSQNMVLEEIDCRDNQLTILLLGANPNLTKLQCQNNSLSNLDVGQNMGLEKLKLTNNNLTSLQVSQNLKILASGNNQLTYLDLSEDDSLVSFSAKNNQLTSLDIRNNNNENIDFFSTENNPDLTCIFVDDKTYSQTNPDWHKDSSAHFVETQQECNALGVESFNLEKIKIYPNPVKNNLQFSLPYDFQKLNGNILDLSGKIIMDFKLENPKTTLQLSQLPPGMYFLVLRNKRTLLLTKKIIKL